MLEAALWGLAGASSLLVGAAAGLGLKASQRTVGLVMAFGAGALISALAFELTGEAFEVGGTDAVALGLAAGGLVFYLGDRWICSAGGAHRKRSGGQMAGGSANVLLLGVLLDGIPESAAIGISLVEGGEVGIALVVAVALSNLPESLSSATGMRKAGHSNPHILAVWGAVALLSALSAGLGYSLLGDASENAVAVTQAFAAGAILVMLADTMMPEAFEHGGKPVGLVTLLGFALAFLISATG